MIEIRIIEHHTGQWLAQAIQRTTLTTPAKGPVRTLQRIFPTAGEAWLWAKSIINRARKETLE